MTYKTTADLLQAKNLENVEGSTIRPTNLMENLQYTFGGSRVRQEAPPFTGEFQPSRQGVADVTRMNSQKTVKQRLSLRGLGQKASESGINAFNSRTAPAEVKIKQESEPSFLDLNKGLSDIDLTYRKKIEDATLQSNINRIKQYEPLANNEANRAYGMKLDNDNRALGNELATKLPYSSFEENLRSMRQAGINATNLTQSISGAYNSSISKLNPVSMSL